MAKLNLNRFVMPDRFSPGRFDAYERSVSSHETRLKGKFAVKHRIISVLATQHVRTHLEQIPASPQLICRSCSCGMLTDLSPHPSPPDASPQKHSKPVALIDRTRSCRSEAQQAHLKLHHTLWISPLSWVNVTYGREVLRRVRTPGNSSQYTGIPVPLTQQQGYLYL